MTMFTNKPSNEPSSLTLVRTTTSNPSRSFTVYLVRHGEATHNVDEKRAKKEALTSCIERGLSCDHEETLRAVDEARKEVLRDPSFFDATITKHGRDEARRARETLTKCAEEGLPPPQEVVTSPLQRCLSTVEELFPLNDVHVRVEEDLRERLTGRPADNRFCSEILEERFPRFDFTRLRSLSQSNLSVDCNLVESDVSDSSLDSGLEDDRSDFSGLSNSDMSASVPARSPFGLRRMSSLNASFELEDDSCVRKRAFQLFKLLDESHSDSVAIVTHKGFLRALERGCFGITGSPEFKNCEVRAYRIEMTPGNMFMDSIERLR